MKRTRGAEPVVSGRLQPSLHRLKRGSLHFSMQATDDRVGRADVGQKLESPRPLLTVDHISLFARACRSKACRSATFCSIASDPCFPIATGFPKAPRLAQVVENRARFGIGHRLQPGAALGIGDPVDLGVTGEVWRRISRSSLGATKPIILWQNYTGATTMLIGNHLTIHDECAKGLRG